MSTIPGDSPAARPAAQAAAAVKTNPTAVANSLSAEGVSLVESFDAVFRSTIKPPPPPRNEPQAEEADFTEELKPEETQPASQPSETTDEAPSEQSAGDDSRNDDGVEKEPQDSEQQEQTAEADDVEPDEQTTEEETQEFTTLEPILLNEPELPKTADVEQQQEQTTHRVIEVQTQEGGGEQQPEQAKQNVTVEVELEQAVTTEAADDEAGEVPLANQVESTEGDKRREVKTDKVETTPQNENGERRPTQVRVEAGDRDPSAETGVEESEDSQQPQEAGPRRVRRTQAKETASQLPTDFEEAKQDLAPQQRLDTSASQGASRRRESATAANPIVETAEPQASGAPTNNGQAVAPPRLPEHLVGPARQTGRQQGVRGMNEARLLGRVAKAFHAAQQRGGPLRIRLHPSELGSLKIELNVENGNLNARLEVETTAARTALVDNLNVLRERLAEQGVRVEQFEVALQADGGGEDAELARQQEESREHAGALEEDSNPDEAGSDNKQGPDWDGNLNVVV